MKSAIPIKETEDRKNAIIWWTSLTPSEQSELRYKHVPLANLIDMSGENIEYIWKKENSPVS